MKYKSKGYIELAFSPWLILIMVLFIAIIIVVVWFKTYSLVYSDKTTTSSYSLYAMLNSNDCTPKTKIPFKDVLAIAIAEGNVDEVQLNYSGIVEKISIQTCLNIYKTKMGLPSTYYFYVESYACPAGNSYRCLQYSRISGILPTPLTSSYNIEISEPIALSDGKVGRVVFKASTQE